MLSISKTAIAIVSACLSFAALIALCARAEANTLLVPSEYSSLGIAVFAAQPGDTIQIAPGTYYVNYLYLNGKSLTITGDSAADTILDGSQASGPIFVLANYDITDNPYHHPTSEATIENLTLQNCNSVPSTAGQSDDGGAVVMSFSSPTITHCAFVGNTVAGATGSAASVSDNGSNGSGEFDPGVTELGDYWGDGDSTESANGSVYEYGGPGGTGAGGAISGGESSPTISYCDFRSNHAYGGGGGPGANGGDAWGGAIALADSGNSVTISNCTFENNQAVGGQPNDNYSITIHNSGVLNLNGGSAGGGAVELLSCTATLLNCLFSANGSASAAAGASFTSGNASGGAVNAIGSATTISNCVVNGNSANAAGGGYSAGAGVFSGIFNDPETGLPNFPTLDINSSTIANNAATGTKFDDYLGHGSAIYSDYRQNPDASFILTPATLENCIIDNNYNSDATDPDVMMQACSGNVANTDFNNIGGQIPFIGNMSRSGDVIIRGPDPKLVDVANGNLQLEWDSPCRGTGVYDPKLPQTDYDGVARANPPSMGAYEFHRTLTPGGLTFQQAAGFSWPNPVFQLVDSSGTASVSDIPSSDLTIQWGDGAPNTQGVVTIDHIDDAGTHFNVSDADQHVYASDGTYYPQLYLSSSLLNNYFSYTTNSAISTAYVGGYSGLPAASVTVTSTVNPLPEDESTTLVANVTTPGAFLPSGNVAFYANGQLIGTAGFGYKVGITTVLNDAALSWTPPSVGTFTITAVYEGDANDAPGTGTLQQTVEGFATGATLTPFSIAPVGIASNLQATVSPLYTFLPTGYGYFPLGVVELYDGNTLIDEAFLSFYEPPDTTFATLQPVFTTAGTHNLTLQYPGGGIYASCSTTLSVNVPQATPTLTVSASPGLVLVGQPVTFTATLAGAVNPTGMVQFYVNGAAYGLPVAVSNGQATLSASTIGVGSYNLFATYFGDANNAGAPGQSEAYFTVASTLTPGLRAIMLSPASTQGGTETTENRVYLKNTPSVATTVTLSSSNPAVATVPSSVTVQQGYSSRAFTISAKKVISPQQVTITATANGTTQTAVLTVTPAPVNLKSVTLSPAGTQGGTSTTANRVYLTGDALAATVVTLTSSNPAVASVPSTVTVQQGFSSHVFTIMTKAVTSAQSVTITAASGGVTQTTQLTVMP